MCGIRSLLLNPQIFMYKVIKHVVIKNPINVKDIKLNPSQAPSPIILGMQVKYFTCITFPITN